MPDTPSSLATIIANITDTGSTNRITPAIIRQAFEGSVNWVPAVVSAAGTTQGTANSLTSMVNIVTTVAAGSGVVATTGYTEVWNEGANTLLVYPVSGAQFETYGTNNPVTVGVGGFARFVMTSTTQGYVR